MISCSPKNCWAFAFIGESAVVAYPIKLKTFSDNSFLLFEDIRKFGGFYYCENLSHLKNNIGLDPIIDKAFTSNGSNSYN